MNPSIRNRLLSTTTVVLVVFLALTGYVLDRAYQASVLSGVEEQLKLVIYAVMSVVEEESAQLVVLEGLSEPRLSQPDSGLYAQISDDLSGAIWTSASAVATDVRFSQIDSEPGAFVFSEATGRYQLIYTVIWEGLETERVNFIAATDQAPVVRSIHQFRGTLGAGFALSMVFFIVAQLAALRWGLRPLRDMAEEVEALEKGEKEQMSDTYPLELQGLAGNLDRFVEHEQRSRTRYRNALEDLAHSLKTPLAVVKNSLLELQPDKGLMGEQLERMSSTVTHQLSKASARGPVVVGKPVDISKQINRLVPALKTAYVDKGIQIELVLAETAFVRGDESDFLEIFGNLLENAFKYTATEVAVCLNVVELGSGRAAIEVFVEDNGRGIPLERRKEVLNRGKRLDEIEPGQGIGLAVVADLVELYGGRLTISDSDLGGARIRVQLPY